MSVRRREGEGGLNPVRRRGSPVAGASEVDA
jgi:hypothetical protein